MTGDSLDPTTLEAAMCDIYRGPLEEFIGRRDSLAKQLRAARRREDADQVKALRKPSRVAWALDQVVFDEPTHVARLQQTILAAQKGRGDGARAAQDDVRAAVRAVAEAGERISARSGQTLAAAALVTATRAVIGDASAFADLLVGRLVDVPEGGGLDLLVPLVLTGSEPAGTAPAPKAAQPDHEAERVGAALREAEAALTKARERARAAERAMMRAQAEMDAAEERLGLAQRQADERRAELERVRGDATAAGEGLAAAEKAAADLRKRT